MRFSLLLLFAGLNLTPQKSYSQSNDTLNIPGVVLCKLKDGSSGVLDTAGLPNQLLKQIYLKFGVTKVDKPAKGISPRLDRIYRIALRPGATDSLIQALLLLPQIEFAEPEPMFRISDFPDDFNPADQYFLSLIGAPQAWDELQGANTVTVAVIDNGVLTSHEDLAANIWTNPDEIPDNGLDDDLNGYTDDVHGYDVADYDNKPDPPLGIADTTAWIHGTHCSGICSAVTGNKKGVASLGRYLKIIPVKATRDSDNPRSIRNGFDGVVYAINAGADIISMSFGTTVNSSAVRILMEDARINGIVVVAAAGNSDTEQPEYPAAYADVISVAATDQSDRKAGFSNYGNWVTVSAPGVNIRSTFAGSSSSYGAISGTSMSTPLVASLAGLILAKFPKLTPAEIKERIRSSADNIDAKNPGYTGKLGAGRINAARALAGLSVGDTQEGIQLHVYPNPVPKGEQLWVGTKRNKEVLLQVTDLQGRVVISKQSNGQDQTAISFAGLEAGMYILRCSGQGVPESVQRIVVY